MHLTKISVKQSLNKAYLKETVIRTDIELFKSNFTTFLNNTNANKSDEEHLKSQVIHLLWDTWYKDKHHINPIGKNDLVIHTGKSTSDAIGVIIEVKSITNTSEMLSFKKPNVKALHELILYYLAERIEAGNNKIKFLIATNIDDWYIFDANEFDKKIFRNPAIKKLYELKKADKKDNPWFYDELKKLLEQLTDLHLEPTHFNIREFEKVILNKNKEDDNHIIPLYKILSPVHLLKLSFANDSNSLQPKFYAELLHLIGLTEIKEGSKKLIQRKKEGQRDAGSLLENTITQLDSHDKISRMERPSQYGADYQERLYSVALELVITWINRILFLKLLEAQLISYHKGDPDYTFLNKEKIKDFDDLDKLFFRVLAKNQQERSDDIQKLFGKVPYLNSSLFEPTEIEHQTLFINGLEDYVALPLIASSILKDGNSNIRKGSLNTLDYLFEFLNAYNFSSEGSGQIQEDNKTLINASVLGLIFEKINGYKDGSFFTPGFITMYMCRETIRRAVVQKFNEAKGWDCKEYNDLYNQIEDKAEANAIINSLKICDPAVGSGHFLVSALNEIIAIKHDLRILLDRDGKRLKEYHVEVGNDELMITDEDGDPFKYNPEHKESQRVQETMFHEKQTIIENCLFGVDINPNSVKICRLRLWIELLKNAYYKSGESDKKSRIGSMMGIEPTVRMKGLEPQLETLPNIDINIKCGNSLISRFGLDADLKQALKKSKFSIDAYQVAVQTYRNAENKEQKREMERLIETIKNDFRTEISQNDPKVKKLDRLGLELYSKYQTNKLFDEQLTKAQKNDRVQLETEIRKLSVDIQEIKDNKIYENAFEWRFEFPDVLNDEGDFVGFDVVIGNPPYFSLSKIKEQANYFENSGYQTYSKGSDIYCLFYERGIQVLKENGFLTYITSNSWLKAIYGDLLKKYLREQTQPTSLLNIEDIQIFEEATVESNIITLQKRRSKEHLIVCNLSSSYIIGSSLSEYFLANSFEYAIPESSEWIINTEETGKLKQKIEKDSKFLKEFDVNINFGIKTGYNAAFIIDETTKTKLIEEDYSSYRIIKPILRGRDLKKYSHEFANQWAICTFPSLKLKIENYPAIESHFLNIGKERLEQIGNVGSRKKTNNKWFETQDSISYWKDLESPKIVWGEISDKPKFAYDDENYYAEATTFIMTGEKLKYLLAILNSKVSEWFFNQISTTTGMGTNRWKKYKIEAFPIKIPNNEQEFNIESIANQIISIKKADPKADTNILEKEIDQLVYQLYGLTEEEIKIVEGKENSLNSN